MLCLEPRDLTTL
ncbi:hypothetical protein RSAG8_13871, partial [Rhizoctonia solani AG-8 WAC10335]